MRVEPHEPGGRRVGGQGEGAQDQGADRLGLSHDRAVSLHADDSVDDAVVDLDRPGQIQDGPFNPPDVEQVLGPAVVDSRQNAEEVLQAQGDPDPMMGFHLGQADQDVGFGHRLGQIKMRKAGQAALVRHGHGIAVVEVHASDLLVQDGPE